MTSTLTRGLIGSLIVLGALTSTSAGELPEQTSRAEGVTVRAKPVVVPENAKTWSFSLTFDTHSGELADDPLRSAVLVGPGAVQTAASDWKGDPPGGHHRKGVVHFPAITPLPDVIDLVLQRPGESAPRRFRWTLR